MTVTNRTIDRLRTFAHCFSIDGHYYLYNVDSVDAYEIDGETYDILRKCQDAPPESVAEDLGIALSDVHETLEDVASAVRALQSQTGQRGNEGAADGLTPDLNSPLTQLLLMPQSTGDGSPVLNDETARAAIHLLAAEQDEASPPRFVFDSFQAGTLKSVETVSAYARQTLPHSTKIHVLLRAPLPAGDALDVCRRLRASQVTPMIHADRALAWVGDDGRATLEAIDQEWTSSPVANFCLESGDALQAVRDLLFANGRDKTFVDLAYDDDGTLLLSSEDADALKKVIYDLASQYTGEQAGGNEFLIANWVRYIRRIRRQQKLVHSDPAGIQSIAVHPSGTVYPSPDFANRDAFPLGSVWDGLEEEQRTTFLDGVATAHEKCSSCFARHLCAGGPTNQLLRGDGTLRERRELHCQLIRFFIEVAIHLQARIAEERPHVLPERPVPVNSQDITSGDYSVVLVNP